MTIDVVREAQEGHRRDREARDELNRLARTGYRAAKEARKAELPQVRFEPAVTAPVAGERYVLATERVTAWDPVDGREFVAATPGTWLREGYARALDLGGDAVQLAWRAS